MAPYSFQDFFGKCPLVFTKYYDIAEHPKNFYRQLDDLSLFSGVKSILSIGAGEGVLEVRAAVEHRTLLGYVDPSTPFYESFLQKVAAAGIEKQLVEAYNAQFQTCELKHTYDLVISSHSWYAFGLDRQMLEKALSAVAAGGHLFITILSDKSITYDLGVLLRNFDEEHLTAERLSQWALSEGFAHRYVMNEKRVPWSVFCTPDGELTQSGQDFSAFLMTTPWAEIPDKIRDAAVELFAKHRQGDDVILRCGCLVFDQS
jgi:hypothetical protein